jgi:hypothetical protein
MPSGLDQLLPLLGVALGAVGALTATAVTDRMRFRREFDFRWDQERLKAYTAFAATLKEVLDTAYRMTAERRPVSRSQPLDREAALERLAAARLRRTTDWEALLLLADDTVVAAGRQWRNAIVDVERLAREPVADAAEWTATFDAAVDAVDVARDGFYLAARASLHVRGGSVAQADILRGIRDARG